MFKSGHKLSNMRKLAVFFLTCSLGLISFPSLGAQSSSVLTFVSAEAFGFSGSSQHGVNVVLEGDWGASTSIFASDSVECITVETKDSGRSEWVVSAQNFVQFTMINSKKTLHIEFEAMTTPNYSVRVTAICEVLFTNEAATKQWQVSLGQQVTAEDNIPEIDTSEPSVYKISPGSSHQSLALYHSNPQVKCWISLRYIDGVLNARPVGSWSFISGVGCSRGLQFPQVAASRLAEWYKFPNKTGTQAFYPTNGKYILNAPVVIYFTAGRDTVSILGDTERRVAVGTMPVSAPPAPVTKVSWKAGKTFADLRWEKVRNPGAGPLLGYMVSQTAGEKIESGPWVMTPGQASVRVGLKPGVPYTLSIRAFSQFGLSDAVVSSFTLPTKPIFTKLPSILNASVSSKPELEFETIAEPRGSTSTSWYLCKASTLPSLTEANISTKCTANKVSAGKPSALEASSVSMYLVGKVTAVNKLGSTSTLSEPVPVSGYFSGTLSIIEPQAEGGSYRLDMSEAGWGAAAPSFTFQWFNCSEEFIAEKNRPLPVNCTPIKGSTGQFYVPKPSESGNFVVRVSASSKKFGKTVAYTNSVFRPGVF